MNIIGVVCVGPNEGKRYLKEVLEEKSKLCDTVIVLGDNIKGRATFNLCETFKNVEYYVTDKSLFNTRQWLLKYMALQLVIDKKPDWILAFDADELLDERINRQQLEDMANSGADSYGFTFVHLWGDRKHIRIDRGWRSLNKIIFYKYQADKEQKFPRRALHCGLVPEYANKGGIQFSGFIVKHLGYMKPKDRPAKVQRYRKFDAKGFLKPLWWYESINQDGEVVAFNEKDFIKTIPTE